MGHLQRAVTAVAALAMAAAAGTAAQAAEPAAYPIRSVKVIVPHAAGGGTDVLARIISERLQASLGQPFIVENKPGAGINIATAYVAQQPADGYTLLVTTNTHSMNVAFFKKLPYDPVKDFAPISLVATSPLLMVVNAASPVRTAADFARLAKAKPGVLTYASTGVGTPQHMVPAMLESALGVQLIHVPYKGAGLVANAVLAGEVDMAVGAVNSLIPHIKAGKLRPIAVAGAARSKIMPEVPTLAEALALPDFSAELWYAVFAPAGTPKAVIDKLNAEINRIVRDPEVQSAKLTPLGIEGVGSTPETLTEAIKSDIPKYVKAAHDASISPE